MYKKTVLKNGLRVITIPQKNTEAITILVLVGTGSKYEKKEVSGISHFLEHMYFKGTKKKRLPIDVAETLDRIGGIYNAFTGQEYTGYYAKVASEHFETALEWVSDIFLNSTLPGKEIEKEKGVIIQEINMGYDNPMNHIGSLWSKLLYGDQPAGWDIAGTKDSVSSITRKNLVDYMKRQYAAANTIVCVAGKIDNSSVVKKVESYFSGISLSTPSKKPALIEKQSEPKIIFEYRKTDQAHLYLGVRGYNLFHPMKYTQKLLSVILGGMMSSRLFIEIREKLGAAYYISAYSHSDTDSGYLAARAGADIKKTEKVISAILKQFKMMKQKKVSNEELKKVKDYIKGKTTLLLESSDAQASFYANQELFENRILKPKEIFAKIDRITQDDILMTARDIFQPGNLNLAVIGPFKNKRGLEKILEI